MTGNDLKLMLFSKHLAGPPLREIAQRLVEMGVHSIDLTVRPGGHVEPERVEEDLPKAFEDLSKEGVQIGMITTAITDAHAPFTESILRTAARLRIRYYKIGYYRYKGFGTLTRQIADIGAKFKDLSVLNRELEIHGAYHNHSADFFGASLPDIEEVLKQTDPAWLGCYFDPAHAVIEGGSCGWLMGLERVRDRVSMLGVKDFRWVDKLVGYAGGRRSAIQWCPLEDGNTPWPEVLQVLKQIGFDGPISFHSEYQGPHSFQDLSVDEILKQSAKDMAAFRHWFTQLQSTSPLPTP